MTAYHSHGAPKKARALMAAGVFITSFTVECAELKTSATRQDVEHSIRRWTDRVIPMPKNIAVSGSATDTVEDIALDMPTIDSPSEKTIRALLSSFAKGKKETAAVQLTARVTSGDEKDLPPAVRSLKSAPNSDQAYAIIYEEKNDKRIYRLLAFSPEGLLYAARTFALLVRPPDNNSGNATVELPFLEVTDWPDIADRGSWGSSGHYNLDWYARWKLNSFDHRFGSQFDMTRSRAVPDRLPPLITPQANEQARLVQYAAELGVRVAPIIPHIGDGQMKLVRDIQDDPALAFAKDILARPGPNGEKARGLCMSNPKTIQLLTDCFIQAASLSPFSRKPCEVWLTEGGDVACHCHECQGHNGYLLEATGIVKAFELARKKVPELELRLMGSQGSYSVNSQILERLPPDAGFVYYNGFLSYSTDHQPLIPDYLEKFAKTGHYASAYMDVNPSYFAVFPGSMPQFIRFRAEELRKKALSGVVAYCVPDGRFYEVNVAALAEWTWNANGRSIKDFARAFATITGVAEPDLYAEWIAQAGEAAWWLADSRFIEALCYNPAVIKNPIAPGYPKGDVRMKVYPIPELDKVIAKARAAMVLADRSGNNQMKYESACVMAGLYAYELAEAIRVAKKQNAPKTEMISQIDKLEIYAQRIRAYHDAWYRDMSTKSEAASRKSPLYPAFGKEADYPVKTPRVSIPEYALFRACDVWRQTEGIPLPIVGEWTNADFDKKRRAALSFDLSRIVPSDRETVFVSLEYGSGECIYYRGMSLIRSKGPEQISETVGADQCTRRLNRAVEDRCLDKTFQLPIRKTNERLRLNIALQIPVLERPIRFNPLTDGVSNVAASANITGKALVRPVWSLGQTGTNNLSAIEDWKKERKTE